MSIISKNGEEAHAQKRKPLGKTAQAPRDEMRMSNENEVEKKMVSLPRESYLLELFDRPIAFHPVLARLTGSVAAGLFLSQAIYWQKRIPAKRLAGCPGPDWFFHTIEEWAEETAMGRDEQKSARKRLVALGLLEEKRAGIPARLFYRVKVEEIEKMLKKQQIAAKPQTRSRQSRRQDGRFAAGKDTASSQTTTEIRPEITAEITPPPGFRHGKTKSASRNDGGREIPDSNPYNQKINSEDIDPKSSDSVDEYIRFGRLFGGKGGNPPHSPSGWEVATRKRIDTQGGLFPIDIEQLRAWVKREQLKKKAIRQKEVEEAEEEERGRRQKEEIDQLYAAFEALPDNEKRKIRNHAQGKGVSAGGPAWRPQIALIMRQIVARQGAAPPGRA